MSINEWMKSKAGWIAPRISNVTRLTLRVFVGKRYWIKDVP
jgi:hypothetical protein